MGMLKKIIFVILLFAQVTLVEARVVNKVVAVVNDEVITEQDVRQMLAVLYAQYVQSYSKDKLLKKMEEARKSILEQMIEDKLVLSRAKELNIKVTDEEVDDKLDRVKRAFPSEREFYEMLDTQGITIADLKKRYRDQIMMKKVVEFAIKSKVDVLPSEVSEYYKEHRSEFKREEEYKVRHILIKATDEVSFELARVEIQDIYEKLLKGEDFGELAKKYSQGPNREKGGDMGYIKLGRMRKELDDVIQSLRPGEISTPIKTDLGYHLLKLEDIRFSGYYSFGEVQNQIKRMLYHEKFRKLINKWLADLKAKAYISIK